MLYLICGVWVGISLGFFEKDLVMVNLKCKEIVDKIK